MNQEGRRTILHVEDHRQLRDSIAHVLVRYRFGVTDAGPSQGLDRRVEVEKPVGRRTILIVDDDLGFVLWAGRALTDAGYAVMPADSVDHARALVIDHRLEVGVLIVNPGLYGTTQFIDALRAEQGMVKVLALEQPISPISGLHAVVSRPTCAGSAESAAWLRSVERLCV